MRRATRRAAGPCPRARACRSGRSTHADRPPGRTAGPGPRARRISLKRPSRTIADGAVTPSAWYSETTGRARRGPGAGDRGGEADARRPGAAPASAGKPPPAPAASASRPAATPAPRPGAAPRPARGRSAAPGLTARRTTSCTRGPARRASLRGRRRTAPSCDPPSPSAATLRAPRRPARPGSETAAKYACRARRICSSVSDASSTRHIARSRRLCGSACVSGSDGTAGSGISERR